MTIFIHNICTTVIGDGTPINGPIRAKRIADTFTDNWKIMNLRIFLNIVLPYNIALDIDTILSSNITISEASLATSVPLPMAKDTSAFLRAMQSFTPSPVIPVTKPNSFDSNTSLFLSSGRALDTTFNLGIIFFNSSSFILFNSLLESITSALLLTIPTSLAILVAVSLESPVTIMVFIPADFIKFKPSLASFLISSLINIIPTNIFLLILSVG